MSEGVGGVVNELLVQMQSFDQPTGWQKLVSKLTDSVNLLLPMNRQIKKPTPPRPNVLVIAATNRADSLDPALLRPGRFDRALTFERPDMRGRRALLDFYLTKKAHAPELDDDERRAALASITHGYTPVDDRAPVRRGAHQRGPPRRRADELEGRGAGPVDRRGRPRPAGTYTDHERRLIATHEAGHATAAYLVAPDRRLEVLSIIKRREALGMLAHGDAEEVYTAPVGDARADPDRDGRAGRRGAVLQRRVHRSRRRPALRDQRRRADGRRRRYGRHVDLVRRRAGQRLQRQQPGRPRPRRQRRTSTRRGAAAGAEDHRQGQLEANQHLIAALRDALVERHELIGHEITDVLKAAQITGDKIKAGEPSQFASAQPAAPLMIDLRDEVVADRLTS